MIAGRGTIPRPFFCRYRPARPQLDPKQPGKRLRAAAEV